MNHESRIILLDSWSYYEEEKCRRLSSDGWALVSNATPVSVEIAGESSVLRFGIYSNERPLDFVNTPECHASIETTNWIIYIISFDSVFSTLLLYFSEPEMKCITWSP